jgi:hypothetical protein
MIKSCAQCKFSLKRDRFELGSPLFCYNRECSDDGKSFWTPCYSARGVISGKCGPEGKYHVDKSPSPS